MQMYSLDVQRSQEIYMVRGGEDKFGGFHEYFLDSKEDLHSLLILDEDISSLDLVI